MANQLFRRKSIDKIVKDVDLPGDDIHSHGLKRVLTVRDLTFFGIAAIIGAGSFSSLGGAVFNGGPGVVILFIITGIACAFTAFCYSEFASRIPVAGSAYTYAYASFGELFAWIIGWALIMEYSIGNIYVAFSWSDYFTSFMDKMGVHVPDYLTCSYREAQKAIAGGTTNPEMLSAWNNAPMLGGLRMIFDLPALIINLLITYLVYRGIKESRNFSNAMVILKLAIVALIIIVGGALVFSNGLTFNWTPPDDHGVKSFMPNGFGGVMMAVSGVFFAYIGFDAVSVLAEESKNPQRDLPRAMILSLVVCTIVYILLTLVLTGAVNYRNFDGVGDPLAFIFEKQNLDIGWMQVLVSICAVVAMTSVLLVFQMGQPRMWMSMSRDGLMPPAFQKIHKKFKTPSFATIVTGLVVGIPILFTDKTFVLDFTSIATLFAFVLVCGGVLLLPKKEKTPGRFSMPYINGKFIFPAIIATAIILLSVLAKGYFQDKVDFSREKKIDAIAAIIPAKNFDTAAVAANLEKHLAASTEKDSLFIKFSSAFISTAAPADKVAAANEFVSNNNTTQSRTAKISLTIFWLLMIGLCLLTFVKKYSLIPLLGVSTCLYLLTGMTLNNWLWFGGWLLLGLVIYFLYGYKKSRLANPQS
jgi:basic amino acid/polyamine antiporter, APA family